MLKRDRKKNLFVISFLAFPMFLFLLYWVGTHITSVMIVFQKFTYLEGARVRTWVGLENFRLFFEALFITKDVMATAFKNSLLLYLLNLVIAWPLYITFSYYLFKKFYGHTAIQIIVLIPSMLAGFIMVMLFKYIIGINGPIALLYYKINPEGIFVSPLLDNRYQFGTIVFYNIWMSFATSLIIYPNAMRAISQDVIDSARIDGVKGMFMELRHVILPLIFPTLSTFLITGFAGIMTNSANLHTFFEWDAPESLYNMGYMIQRLTMFGGEQVYGYATAAGLVIAMFTMPLTYFLKWIFEKYDPTRDSV